MNKLDNFAGKYFRNLNTLFGAAKVEKIIDLHNDDKIETHLKKALKSVSGKKEAYIIVVSR
jgi:hypothetical protein